MDAIPCRQSLGDRCLLWRRRHESVPRHDTDKLLAVGRPAGIYDCSDITKILGTNVGRHDDQRAVRAIVRVAKVMDAIRVG